MRRDLLIAVMLGALVLLISHLGVFELVPLPPRPTAWLLLVLATIVQVVGGRRFYRGAWAGLRHFSADMNTLIALGTTAAWGYSTAVVLFPQPFLAAAGAGASVLHCSISTPRRSSSRSSCSGAISKRGRAAVPPMPSGPCSGCRRRRRACCATATP